MGMMNFGAFVTTIFCGIALLTQGQLALEGALTGISLCVNVVIPSTFAFMVIGCFIPLSGLSKWVNIPFRPITKWLLGLPDELGAAVLMSMLGGYPAGIKTISTLWDYHLVSKETAQRVCYYAVNPSPAFVITAIGGMMWGDSSIGLRLYCGQVISSILMGLFFRPKKEQKKTVTAKAIPLEQAFVLAVHNATGAMLTICSFILFFSVITALFTYYSQQLPPLLSLFLTGVLEVTIGCQKAATATGTTGILLTAFFLSFGGLSIAYQNLSIAHKSELELPNFILVRFCGGIIATIVTDVILRLFPMTTSVMLGMSKPTLVYSTNQGIGTLCLLGMAICLFNTAEKLQNPLKKTDFRRM